MTAITSIQPQFLEFIPERLEPGVLYISRRFSTATHLCCSGCGNEIVTPLNPAKWRLIERGGKVSLVPSIGNWSLSCQAHYWITDNKVRVAPVMSPAIIAGARARDRQDAQLLTAGPEGWLRRIGRGALKAWIKVKKLASGGCR